MGIFVNKINGLGTGLGRKLTEIISEADSVEDKFNALNITFPQETSKISIIPSPTYDSIEAVFDYQQNSGGIDEIGLEQAKQGLRNIGLKQRAEEFYFSKGGYEVWTEDNKVHAKLTKKPKYEEATFLKCIKFYMIVFNNLLGDNIEEKTEFEDQKSVCNYISTQLRNESMKKGDELEFTYRNKEMRVVVPDFDDTQIIVNVYFDLSPEQLDSYKIKNIPDDKQFNFIGTGGAGCTKYPKDTKANDIIEVVRNAMSALDYLIQIIPAQK